VKGAPANHDGAERQIGASDVLKGDDLLHRVSHDHVTKIDRGRIGVER